MKTEYYTIQTARKGRQLKINKQKVQTLKDLKLQISRQLAIDIGNLRLLTNNKEIKDPDGRLLKEMKLLQTDQIKAISKIQPTKNAQQSSNRQQSPIYQLQEQSQEESLNELEQKIQSTTQKLINRGIKQAKKWSTLSQGNETLAIALSINNAEYLSQPVKYFRIQWIKRLIPKLLKCKQFQSKLSMFTSKNGLLQYVFNKMGKKIPSFKFLLQQENKILLELTKQMFQVQEFPRDPKNLKKCQQSLSKVVSKEIISSLSKLTSSQKARQIVQMTQNDLHSAIEVLHKGPRILQQHRLFRMSEFQRQKIQFLEQWEEQPFIFRWLTSQSNIILRLQLQMDAQYLKAYLLSMKHIKPDFYELLLKHRDYILKIITNHPAPLTRPSRLQK